MNLLLDTQAFLWLDGDQGKISAIAREACSNLGNILWLSVASAWEIQIKSGLGKLRLARPLDLIIAEQQSANGIQVLAIQLSHVIALNGMPPHHRDPFDRLLIAQAKSEGWQIVTKDPQFKAYDVPVIW